MDAADPGRRQLGEVLLEAGLLSERDLAVTLAEQQRSGRRLGEILVARGLVSGAALGNALAEQHGRFLRTEHGFATGLGGLIGSRVAPASRRRAYDLEVQTPPQPDLNQVLFVQIEISMGAVAPERRQLGEVLLEAGLLSERDLAVTLAEQQRSGRRLGEILVARGLVSGAALGNALAEQHGRFLRTEYGFATGLGGLIGSSVAPASRPARPEDGPPAATSPAAAVRFGGAPATAGGSAEEKSRGAEPAEVRDLAQPLHGPEAPNEPAAIPTMSSSEQRRAYDLEVQTLPQLDLNHVLFVPTPGGYLLLQRIGEAPAPGQHLELPEAPNARLYVSKIARSPLPLDERICAYLQAL